MDQELRKLIRDMRYAAVRSGVFHENPYHSSHAVYSAKLKDLIDHLDRVGL
jgi:hypothetical protein